MKHKFYNFFKAVAIVALFAGSAAAKAGDTTYFVDHEIIKPGEKLVVPFAIPHAQDYLECYPEGSLTINQSLVLASVTWNYKSGESSALIDGNKRYGQQVTLKTEAMKNGDPVAKLVDKSGKLIITNIGKVDALIGCRYDEAIY